MTVLTKITIAKSEALHRRLTDSYSWHKALWASFPGREDEARNFLFRVDGKETFFEVLMLSPSEPEHLDWGQWHSKVIDDSFLDRPSYRFQIKANPTMRRCSDGRRLGLYNEELLKGWITRKAAHNGFALVDESLEVGAPIDQTFIRNNKRGKHVSVEFRGVLQVQDKLKFRNGFINGIGSAKSFGYGMLMLQPVNI